MSVFICRELNFHMIMWIFENFLNCDLHTSSSFNLDSIFVYMWDVICVCVCVCVCMCICAVNKMIIYVLT